MVGRMIKSRDERARASQNDGEFKKKRKKMSFSKEGGDKKRPRRGPRLPNALRKELEGSRSDGDEDIEFDGAVGGDVYEYEEGAAEEETKKNKRFDPIENYQEVYHQTYEEEIIPSDEGELEGDEDDDGNDAGKHARMLQGITGLPKDVFTGEKRKDFIISETNPESEYNPSQDILDGNGRISIEDLMDTLPGKSGFSKVRKNLRRMEKKSIPTLKPLPKPEQDRLERKAAYELSKKDITKWEPLVKRNREAPTLYFDDDVDLGYTTIGAIAAEFEPRTDFEKKIAALVNHKEVVEAHQKDGARLLELNELSVEDVKERQDRLAKMRSILFRHEMKAKRIKKIKSKTYHRLLKRDRKKSAEAAVLMDPEAAKELAMKQEFKRAQERMTLKHKNSSKWAKRIKQRGINIQDDTTREALGEQLNLHNALTRKMNSLRDSSSSEESSDDDESDYDTYDGSGKETIEKNLMKAKEKTLKELEQDDELPKEGVLSLPFMARGLKKRKEAAEEEAKLAIEEYESSLKQLEDKSSLRSHEVGSSSGRRVFGVPKTATIETNKDRSDNYYGNSDSEDDIHLKVDNAIEHKRDDNSLREIEIDPNLLREECEVNHDSVFKSFEDIVQDPDTRKSYEVAFLASDTWRKVKSSSDVEQTEVSVATARSSEITVGSLQHNHNAEEVDDDGDNDGADETDSDDEMVDGILSSGTKSAYELPSQAELIERAFAGDDVQEDFEKDKEAVLNEENPEPEKPAALPGWGQWTDIQKKRGLPSWMLEEHNMAKKRREEALKKRKDAHLGNVIISEKLDKKAEKLHTKTLPYPYTSKEVFEQSIRMPIGPEFNPATAIGALNHPEVVKRAGFKIKPIKYEDMNIHESRQSHKHKGEKSKKGKSGNQSVRKKTAKV